MLKYFVYFFLIILLAFIIHSVFLHNKTVFILLHAVIVFIIVTFYLFYLGFEFLALSFFITYVGAIAVMFLFLIIVLDVVKENYKPEEKFVKSNVYIPLLVSLLVIFFSFLLISNYDFKFYNDVLFFEWYSYFYHDYVQQYSYFVYNCYNDTINTLYSYFNYKVPLRSYEIMYHEWTSLHIIFSDTFIIGVFLYLKEGSILLIEIGCFLLLSVVLSCSLCTARVFVTNYPGSLKPKQIANEHDENL